MSSQLKWNGGQALATIKAKTTERLRRATLFLWEEVVKALNVGNPAPHLNPSLPGRPPRKRTGILQRNVLYEIDEAQGQAKVGITPMAFYGVFLEYGTKKMQARPFMLATLEKNEDRLKEILDG